MTINNKPVWVDVEATGESTKNKYFGRFQVKPFLNHGEKTDAVRLAERYCRGIEQSQLQRQFLTTIAFLQFHVTDTDASWWKEDEKSEELTGPLALLDEEPIYALAAKLGEIQNPEEKKDDGKTEEPAEKA